MFLLLHFSIFSSLLPVPCWILSQLFSGLSSHVLVCITSMGVSLRSGLSSLCQHLMSTSKQFFTSADTLCLVWDLTPEFFLVLLSLAFTTSLHKLGNSKEILSRFLFLPQKQLATARFMTQGSWWQSFLSSASPLVIGGPCAPEHLTPALWWQRVSSGSFLPSHQEADFRFVSIQGLSSEIPIFI